ncbi:MAG: glycosyltransferase family 39 protein, partial [Acidobacteriota bacterium]
MTPPDAENLAGAARDRRRGRAIFLAILVAGALLRFVGLAWDDAHHLHPDERHISMVEENLEFPKSVRQYFDSATSPLNPYNRKHDSFVYGTLPLFLTKAVAKLIHRPGYDGAYLVGRALSALFDLATVWLTYLIARRFGRRRAALGAAALIAFCPLGIQLAHFWTVDSFLTTFVAAALLGSVRIAQGRSSWGGV